MDSLEYIEKFLEIKDLTRPIMSKAIELVMKKLPTPGPDGFTGELYQTFKGELMSVLLKLFQKPEERTCPNSLYEASITLILKPDKAQEKQTNVP